MRLVRAVCCCAFFLAFGTVISAQGSSASTSSERAKLALTNSIHAMGGNVPRDVTATGQITTSVGGTERSGTFRFLALGSNLYREEIDFEGKRNVFITIGNSGRKNDSDTARKLDPRNFAGLRNSYYPLARIADDLGSTTVRLEFVEDASASTSGSLRVRFIREIETDANDNEKPEQQVSEVFLDPSTFLPVRLRFNVYSPSLPNDPVPVEVFFEDWKRYAGYAFPTRITKHLNGTLHSVVQLSSIQIATGLTKNQIQAK